jgi:hypothetical protein
MAAREDLDAIEAQAARALEVARYEDEEAAFDYKDSDEVAAAFIMEGERRKAVEEPPGIPFDAEAGRAHSRAMERAFDQVSRDEEIDVTGSGVESADFLPRPDEIDVSAMEAATAEAMRTAGGSAREAYRLHSEVPKAERDAEWHLLDDELAAAVGDEWRGLGAKRLLVELDFDFLVLSGHVVLLMPRLQS